jgi:Glycosyl transferases group 1
VTFVNPSPHKGLWLFARLADMLGSRRPDIPVLVVQPGHSGGSLNAIPGVDFSRYPQIMAAPPVPTPADFFALTRMLVVPSVWEEPFGRVAAEAMINAIPPLVSNHGSLPHVIGGDFSEGGGGRVLPIPDWMTFKTTKLPSEREVEPWYEALCTLWDDPALYRSVAARAHQIAEERYSETVSRKKHVESFASLKPGAARSRHTPKPVAFFLEHRKCHGRAFLNFADLSRTLRRTKSGSSFRAPKASALIRVRQAFLERWVRPTRVAAVAARVM